MCVKLPLKLSTYVWKDCLFVSLSLLSITVHEYVFTPESLLSLFVTLYLFDPVFFGFILQLGSALKNFVRPVVITCMTLCKGTKPASKEHVENYIVHLCYLGLKCIFLSISLNTKHLKQQRNQTMGQFDLDLEHLFTGKP